ncbi:MAG: hypothetical protein JSV85_05935 [Candidatus Bathyarchaeota archaeon]|nr:MAG: hypothetical protein JSV85_05935 [Candidatus Bathyarchaeota archaeon]
MEYLHEKAEESRHNENIGYMVTLAGVLFLIGGTILTAITVSDPEWFLIIPYHITSHPYSLFGLTFTILAYVLLACGITLSVYYTSQRGWYMKRLKQTHTIEKLKRFEIKKD